MEVLQVPGAPATNQATAPRLAELARALQALGPHPQPAAPVSLGLLGHAGELWLLLQDLKPASAAAKAAGRVAADALVTATTRQDAFFFDLSLATGRAGVAWVLCEAHEVLGGPTYLAAAQNLLLHALHDYTLNSPNPNGFGQGKAGMIYALLRLYKQTFSAAVAGLLNRYVLGLIAEINFAASGQVFFKGVRDELAECALLLEDLRTLTGNPTFAYLSRHLVADESSQADAPAASAWRTGWPTSRFWPRQPRYRRLMQRTVLAPIYRFVLREQLFARLALLDVLDVLLTKSFHRTLFMVRLADAPVLDQLSAAAQRLLHTGGVPGELVQDLAALLGAHMQQHPAPRHAALAEVLQLEQQKYAMLLALAAVPATAAPERQLLRHRAFELLNAPQPAFEATPLRWRFPLTLLRLGRNYFFNPTLPDAAIEFGRALDAPPGSFTYLIYPDRDNGQVAEHVLHQGDDELLRLFAEPCTPAAAKARTQGICPDPEFMIRYAVQKGILVQA